jgi:DNA-binding XRE family transcriptional regulator
MTRMSGGKPQKSGSMRIENRLESGADLHAWRIRMALSARELSKLIGVTERSVHRAEQSAVLGIKVKLGMELLQSRLVHGEIALPASLGAAFRRRGCPPKQEPLVFGDELRTYDSRWHGELRTGADLRRWRESVGLYQKELAVLLDVAVTSLVRAEKSQSPSSRVIYGVELLREKLSNGQLDLRPLLQRQPARGRRRKS